MGDVRNPAGMYDLLGEAVRAAGPSWRQLSTTRWVMNLEWYKAVRRAFLRPDADDEDRDESRWEPQEGDTVLGYCITVTGDGGEPHLADGRTDGAARPPYLLEPQVPQDWPLLPREPLPPGRAIRNCLGCDSDRLADILDLGRQPLAERDDGHRYPLGLRECRDCGLVQATWLVDRAEVFPGDHPYVTGSTKALREHFGGLAAEAANLLDDQQLIIDIGANDGTFLAAVRRMMPSARVLAVEPTGAARGCPARAIPVERAFWSRKVAGDVVSALGQAQVITASNVMAHTDDIHGFLDGVAAALADGGTFICENHDFASIALGGQVDTVYHEHLMYFTPATLGRLLEQHGFLVTRTECIPVHGGSFRTWAVRRPDGLQARADQAAVQLGMLLELASGDGKIYGVGAATRAMPLIWFAGLGRWLDRIAEVPGHPKIGSVMPGTSIPVVDEAELIRDQPPTALLLCWHVADSVVPKLRAAGYEGRIIIPLPHARYYRG